MDVPWENERRNERTLDYEEKKRTYLAMEKKKTTHLGRKETTYLALEKTKTTHLGISKEMTYLVMI